MKTLLGALSSLTLTGALCAQDRFVAPAYSGNLEFTTGHSAGADIRLGTRELGELEATRTRVEYRGLFHPGAEFQWGVGVAYTRWDFGREAGNPLPANLQSAALPLTVSWRFREGWQAFGEASPGIYSDFEEISGDAFNAPFVGGVGYTVNPDLQVFVSASVDFRRDIPVVGGPGVRWRFAEDWTLSLLLPRPQIQYRPSADWLLHVGAEMAGGAFHLNPTFGSRRGLPAMDDQQITYREIRTGAGARWGGPKGFQASIEAGWMIDRRFVLDDVRLQFNGDGAVYGQVSIGYRY
ncbi:MAG: DUF6268 family outer membrane beta-barrel protein [Verrucomicrobiota bacterium]